MQNPPPVQTAAKSSTGLDENIAALLSYVFHVISGLIFFLIEKNSRLVRFHAMQALILGALFIVGLFVWMFAWFVVAVIASQLPGVVGGLLSLVATLLIFVFYAALFVGWILGMVKAYQGQYFKLPLIGNFAEKFSAK